MSLKKKNKKEIEFMEEDERLSERGRWKILGEPE